MRRSVNVEVTPRENESDDRMIRRFFKKCKKEDIIREHLDKTQFFRSPRQKRRQKTLNSKYLRKFEKNT